MATVMLNVLQPYKAPTPDNYTGIQVKKLESVRHVQKKCWVSLAKFEEARKGLGGR